MYFARVQRQHPCPCGADGCAARRFSYLARVALPPLSNSFISLVKDTSLAATIQVPELFRQAQLITSRTLEVFTMYLAASLIYWIMATVLSTLQNHFENQLNRQEREPK